MTDRATDANRLLVERITRCQRMLYGYILTLVPQPPDAEDILQETNMALVCKPEAALAAHSFEAWACGVAYFQTLAFLKRTRRDRHSFVDEELLSDLAARLETRMGEQDRRLAAMRRCLDRLPRSSRDLLSQRYDQQYGAEQIARRTGRSAGAVRVALHRARQTLLQCIHRKLQAGGSA